jgi:hypothetical protein
MLDRADVSNNPLRKVDLPDEMVPHPTRLESGSSKLAFRFFSPLTAINCELYTLTLAQITD